MFRPLKNKSTKGNKDSPCATRMGFEFTDGEFKGPLFKSTDLKSVYTYVYSVSMSIAPTQHTYIFHLVCCLPPLGGFHMPVLHREKYHRRCTSIATDLYAAQAASHRLPQSPLLVGGRPVHSHVSRSRDIHPGIHRLPLQQSGSHS